MKNILGNHRSIVFTTYKLGLSILLALLFTVIYYHSAHAAYSGKAPYVDMTKMKHAASYESNYKLVKSYKGKSGVVINSYSSKWDTTAKLQAVETELLKNKHGKELSLLGSVNILPDFPAGKNVLGLYYADYSFNNGVGTLLANRKIELFGGDKFTTVSSIAETLSHEYGHHFTFYQMIERENLPPDKWLSSEYAKARGFTKFSQIGTDESTPYQWRMQELLADDYVQLFGSKEALKTHGPLNDNIPTPFEVSGFEQYWAKYLKDPQYQPKKPIPFHLTNYRTNQINSLFDDLDVEGYTISGPTYLMGRVAHGNYYPSLLTTINTESLFNIWLEQNTLNTYGRQFLYNQLGSDQPISLYLREHENSGFNRGSKTITFTYPSINQSISQFTYNDYPHFTPSQIKDALMSEAHRDGIPPEILKSIAYEETGMRQFDSSGNPILGTNGHGGIGMMQVTPDNTALSLDQTRLKYDTLYNIEMGAKILLRKWNLAYLPTVNDHNKSQLEDWYFAIMAYDGLTKRNDPALSTNTFQNQIYNTIAERSLLGNQMFNFPKPTLSYDSSGDMQFPVTHYQWSALATPSTQMFSVGDTAYVNSQFDQANILNAVGGKVVAKLWPYTPLKIESGPFELSNVNREDVYYKVSGNGVSGYISSAYLHPGHLSIFSDIRDDKRAAAVAYLELNGYVRGYNDGFHPNEQLSREHAAVILDNILHLKAPADYKMKADDVATTNPYYKQLLAMEAYGYMGHGGKLRPHESLTRAQMAQVLTMVFKKDYKTPDTMHQFQDMASIWNPDAVNTLYYNHITVADPFHPNEPISRSQFALFLYLTLSK